MSVRAPLALLASVLRLAAFDVDLGLRADALETTIDASNAPPEHRTTLAALPNVTAMLEAGRGRLSVAYAPRLWTDKPEAWRTPQVTHEVEARLRTQHDRPWNVELTGSRRWGRTEPLLDPARATAHTGVSQVASTRALSHEELGAGISVDAPLDERTSALGSLSWRDAHGTAGDEALLPSQRSVSLDASVQRLVTELDAVRASLRASGTVTDPPYAPRTRSGSATTGATWGHRLGPNLDAWVAGGVAWLVGDLDYPGSSLDARPAGEIGVTRNGERLTAMASLAVTTFVDRYTGKPGSALDLRGALGWRATETLALGASTSVGARADGETVMGAADARAIWTARPDLVVEAGVMGRTQQERRAELPSFLEWAVFASVSWRAERIFGGAGDTPRGAPPLAPNLAPSAGGPR